MQQNHGVTVHLKRSSQKGFNMKEKQNDIQSQEVVSYPKDQIQLLFNILNSMNFTGIQQAQGIAQISVILNNPIVNKNDENETKENIENNEVK